METFIEQVVRRRAWVLLACAALTLLGALSLSQAVVATSVGELFLGDNPRYDRYRELSERFGNDEVVALGIEDPDVLSAEGQERLGAAVAEVRSLSGVQRVRSVLDAVYLEPGSLLPRVVRYADAARADASRIPALLERLRNDPLSGGLLVSADGRAFAVLVELSPAATQSAEGIPDLVKSVLEPFQSRYEARHLHRAGMPALLSETLRQTLFALLVTTPIVCLVLLITVWLLFGRLWPAAVSLSVAAVAVVWTLGVAVLFDRNVNIMMAFVPGVILIISFSDIVHLCSAYLLELAEGHSKERAIVISCAEVGRACLFTSLTTFVGFVSLSLIPVPVFRQLGILLGLGVSVALALAVTLVPILLSLLPEPEPLRSDAGGRVTERVQVFLDRFLAGCERLALGHPKAVCAAFLLLTAASVAATTRLEIETNFTHRLTPNNSVRQDQEWFLASFRASDAIQVYLSAPTPAALSDPTYLAKVAAFQAAVGQVEGVRGTSSIIDVVTAVGRALPGGGSGGDAETGFPAEASRVQAALRLIALGDADDLRLLVDAERGRLRVLVYPSDTAMRRTASVANQVEALGAELLPDTQVEATGLLALFGGFLDTIIAAQKSGLGLSVFTIALLLMIGLRSWRVGLLSMLPNLLPVVVLGGCLGLYDTVDSDTIIMAFIALGIGVDDTIHFLVRLRTEVARGAGSKDGVGGAGSAIRNTFSFAGRGIVMTTLILSCGFLPFLLSDYYFMRLLGSLLPICFVVALLADLLWIPAMAQLGWLRFPSPSEEQPS